MRWTELGREASEGLRSSYGVESSTIEGVTVRLTSPAKTVADCFRYRAHVGLDVALAALRDYRRKGRGKATRLERSVEGTGDASAPGNRYDDPRLYSIDALVEAARVDWVYSVLRPYLEALA